MLLEDKVCLITGTSRGIGAAMASRFAQEGARVYATVRQGQADEDFVPAAGQIAQLVLDVTDPAALKAAILRIKQQQARLDVLVNNAGVMKDALIGMIDRDTIEQNFSVNVYAPIELIQLAAKLMRRQQSGSIINVSSLVGLVGNRGQLAYAAAKGAVVAMTKAAAKELAPSNIRVNAVAPGMIDTQLFRSAGAEAVERFTNSIGLGRVGSPEEVADVCLFLASDLSRYVTGQIIGVDGAALM